MTRRGPQARISVNSLVRAAITLADERGFAFTMRELANHLGVPVMTLYTQIVAKETLVTLMADQVARDMRHADYSQLAWRSRLACVASDNRAVYLDHPWLEHLRPEQPPLGPGTIGKYERELGALASLNFTPVEADACLNLLIGFARASAADTLAAPRYDASWWTIAGPALAHYVTAEQFPLASATGSAVGAQHGAAYSPKHAWDFGLDRILDGIGALGDRR